MTPRPRVGIVGIAAGVIVAAAISLAARQQQTINNTAAVPMGPSGALVSSAGVVDIDTSIVPRLPAANEFSGYNQVAMLRIQPSPTAPPCATADDVGRLWIDSSDAQNTVPRVCLMRKGVATWMF